MATKFVWLAIVGVAAAGVWWCWPVAAERSGPIYRTETLRRRDVVATISASGTIEPEEIVDVGAQVAGRVIEFGIAPDTNAGIDYGSLVEPGTVLARIDDALYREEVELARADLAQAQSQLVQTKAGVLEAQAAVKKAEGDLQHQQSRRTQAERDLQRVELLRKQNAVSQQEADAAVFAAEQSLALMAVAEAALMQAQASLESARSLVTEREAAVARGDALLRKAETNLSYATIKSPIRGVIVDRRVNIGQTVVSNLNAPSLFLIAKDLRRMQVWASVNEADIGSIKEGMPVEFSVDAFPGQDFHGVVKQIRLNATMSQSVVTYTVVVSVDNSSGTLLPYLTANLRFIVAERKQVLAAPAAALRWKPQGAATEKSESAEAESVSVTGAVWLLAGDQPRRFSVQTGVSNGSYVEIAGHDLPAEARLIVGEAPAAKAALKNPFAPSLAQGLDR